MFAAANVGFHLEAAAVGTAAVSSRTGLAILILLILLIGGRVAPSFTHNWLARRAVAARPASFGRADGVVMILSGLALASWIVLPDAPPTGAAALAAGGANPGACRAGAAGPREAIGWCSFCTSAISWRRWDSWRRAPTVSRPT